MKTGGFKKREFRKRNSLFVFGPSQRCQNLLAFLPNLNNILIRSFEKIRISDTDNCPQQNKLNKL